MKVRVLAALLLLAAPVASIQAAQADSIAVLDACIAKLDAQIDIGYDRVARRCPDLAPALEQSGWAAWLPQGWKESRNDLSVGSLRELRRTVARELAPHPVAKIPNVETLKDIISDLGTTGQERSGLWSRFKKWLRSLFERSAQQNDEGWLSRLISRAGVSGAVMEIITYVALGIVVALAGFIVFNELRLAGILKRRRAGNAGDEGASLPADGLRIAWADVERAPLRDQPRLLMQLVASRLTDLKRLPPAGAFTVREIVRTADLKQPADRERLNEIALTSERVRYAESEVSPAVVETAVVNARELLNQLDGRETDAAAGAGEARA
jgi:uncharacterized protein DUF4129